MISALAAAGLRAVAIDLIGFGRSDKPADRDDYTYQAQWTGSAKRSTRSGLRRSRCSAKTGVG